jgi:hypothetical protein
MFGLIKRYCLSPSSTTPSTSTSPTARRPRIVIMSATLQAEKFAAFFGATVIRVPGVFADVCCADAVLTLLSWYRTRVPGQPGALWFDWSLRHHVTLVCNEDSRARHGHPPNQASRCVRRDSTTCTCIQFTIHMLSCA